MKSILFPPGILCALFAVLFAVLATRADAATTATTISEDTANTDDIADNIERQERVEGIFDDWKAPKWVEDYRAWRDKFFEKIGLKIAATYDVAGMTAFGYESPVTGFSGDLTVLGTWLLFGEKWDVPLDLRFRVRQRHAIGGRAASEVDDASGGVIWGLIDGFNDHGFEIPDFQLVQHFRRHDLEIRYGQMTIDSQFDRHALRSSKQAFFNRAFSSNPAVPFPRFGAGLTLVWNPEWFDLSIGASNVQGTQEGSDVNFDLGSGEFFSALQFGRDFKLRDNPARIQAMLWHSDAVQDADLPEGEGLSVTFENWLASSENRLFVRLAWANGAAASVDRLLAAGLAFEHRENDLWGVAAGLGRNSDGSKDWQAVAEGFYRWQIGPNFKITPSLQLVFGSGLERNSLRIVPGIRGGASF